MLALLIKLAVQGVYDRLILTAGDGDFEDAIDYIKTDLKRILVEWQSYHFHRIYRAMTKLFG